MGGVLVERSEVIEGGAEEFLFARGEVAGGFGGEHLERFDDGAGGAEVDLFIAGEGIGELAEEQAGVLRLEDDEFVEPWIGYRGIWHGVSFPVAEWGCKREEGRRAEISGWGSDFADCRKRNSSG